MPRIVVAGVPRAGKSTLARQLAEQFGAQPRQTDSLIELGWSESSAAAAQWLNEPGSWVVEGVAMTRALRKWLAANPGLPADEFYWMGEPRIALSTGQSAMAKGCLTVWNEVAPVLAARGAIIR